MKTVPLGGKKAAGRVALVDDEDYEFVMQYRWHVYEATPKPGRRANGPYAAAQFVIDGHRVVRRMHQMLTGWPMTDHRDHNGLNNQRSNLRPATVAQNTFNARARLGTSSQYKGVHWATRDRRWRAAIKCEGKSKYLGTFWTERDAALAYDIAARELFGEYAVLNFPEIKTNSSTRVSRKPKADTRKRQRKSRRKEPLGYAWMQSALRKRQRREGLVDDF